MLPTKLREEESTLSGRRDFIPADLNYPAFEETDYENQVRQAAKDRLMTGERTDDVYTAKDYADVSPDLLPTQATLRALNRKPAEGFERISRKQEKVMATVSGKGKAVIAVYVVAVVALFLIVIFNAIAIANLNVSTGALEEAVALRANEVAGLNEELASVTDGGVLLDKAQDLGMVSSGSAIAVSGPGVVSGAEETAFSSNWFDWILDLFGNSYGG